MRCGRVRLTVFFPLNNSNFLYQIENVVCYPFRTANFVDNGTKEGQIGEGCLASLGGSLGLWLGLGVLQLLQLTLAALISLIGSLTNKEITRGT